VDALALTGSCLPESLCNAYAVASAAAIPTATTMAIITLRRVTRSIMLMLALRPR
jgi:hypothetical protein